MGEVRSDQGPELADLGTLAGDVIGFGGVVSNAHALEALLAWARAAGIPPARMVSTGDIVAYCAEPARAVALMRDHAIPSIRGNCEESLARDADDCGCGFAPGSLCARLAQAWYAHAREALDRAARAWMAGLPRLAVFRAHGRRWGVVHGGVTAVNRYLWPNDPDAAFMEEIRAFEALAGPVDAILAGHAGIPFRREVAGRLWLNGGALGMPPHDGDPRTSFAVITAAGVRLVRLAYDHHGAARAMRRAGLAQGYERALVTGWWPSEDILPASLRRAARAGLLGLSPDRAPAGASRARVS